MIAEPLLEFVAECLPGVVLQVVEAQPHVARGRRAEEGEQRIVAVDGEARAGIDVAVIRRQHDAGVEAGQRVGEIGEAVVQFLEDRARSVRGGAVFVCLVIEGGRVPVGIGRSVSMPNAVHDRVDGAGVLAVGDPGRLAAEPGGVGGIDDRLRLRDRRGAVHPGHQRCGAEGLRRRDPAVEQRDAVSRSRERQEASGLAELRQVGPPADDAVFGRPRSRRQRGDCRTRRGWEHALQVRVQVGAQPRVWWEILEARASEAVHEHEDDVFRLADSRSDRSCVRRQRQVGHPDQRRHDLNEVDEVGLRGVRAKQIAAVEARE